jgi:hypothetical protein
MVSPNAFCHCCVESKRATIPRVRDWEIIADNLSASGWSWGCVSAIDSEGRTIWIVDAHRDNGRRLVVRADEKLDRVYGTGIGDSEAKG